MEENISEKIPGRDNYLVQQGWSDILPCDPIIGVIN
jgi:hypothetical protein